MGFRFMILHEKTLKDFGYTLETASNYKNFYCICDYCGVEFLRAKRTILQCNQTISKDSCGVGACKRQKSEEVQLKKYGMPNIGSSSESLEKREQTSLERYGCKHYVDSKECKKKNQELYGTDYHTQSQQFRDKLKNTCLEKYGVDHYSKHPEFRKKFKQIFLDKYGVDHYSKTQEFKDKLRTTFLAHYGEDSIFKTDYFAAINKQPFGKMQNELREYLGETFVPNRSVLKGKEIDLFNGSLGIEICGIYWHHEFSPQPRTRSYHFNKYKQCLEQGVRLITIFEDEWKLRKDQCKDFLDAVLGKFKKRIFARQCEIKEIDRHIFDEFCDDNHIQGRVRNISVAFGLYYDNEFVGGVSLGKHHRKNNSKNIVLNRFCFKRGIQIVGGASKLVAACKKWSSGKFDMIVTWSDNRWSDGNVYLNAGFKHDADLPPDYSYVLAKGGSIKRTSKQSCRKSCTKCPEGKTEREWMAENGYARIWDCGKKRWVLVC